MSKASRGPLLRAAMVAAAIAAVLGLLHWWGLGLPLLLLTAAVIGVVAKWAPWVAVRWLDAAILAVRTLFWAREEGRFHAFGGVPLEIDDDGRHVWVGGDGLLRALGRDEPDNVLAARHAGHWRRDAQGGLQLRVDAVVQHLATMPGRDDPRMQRLRRYFEREVLFPAAERRRRGDAQGGPRV